MFEQTTNLIEQTSEQQLEAEALIELGLLQLAVVGGGIGTVVFA